MLTRKYYNLTLSAWLTIITLVLLLVCIAGAAHAASLKVCYKDVPVDTNDIALYVNTTRVPGLFPGQTQTDGSICATLPSLPAAVTRGTAQNYTLRAVNALGEEGPASNALSFRYPQVPASAPTLLSVGAYVP